MSNSRECTALTTVGRPFGQVKHFAEAILTLWTVIVLVLKEFHAFIQILMLKM